MTASPPRPGFAVISGQVVSEILAGRERDVVNLVESAYRLHGNGDTVNPPSYFLRFPDRPANRIIALPAAVGAEVGAVGIKWISSFPGNVAYGLPRASAVLVLNDRETGFPYACLEGSVISASRTAASAALAAFRLSESSGRSGGACRRVGFVGAGPIAQRIYRFLVTLGWPFEQVMVYDTASERAGAFLGSLPNQTGGPPARAASSPEELISCSDLVVLATTAATPHITETSWFAHHPLVLNVSLRDLSTDIILDAVNVVDDIEHCLKADTSPHLAEQRTGSRDFIAGTLYDVLVGSLVPPPDRTVVFSPFGLGVLDLVLGSFVYEECRRDGKLSVIDDFFDGIDTRSPLPRSAGR